MTTVKLFDRNGLEIDHLTRWDYNVKLQIYDFPFKTIFQMRILLFS